MELRASLLLLMQEPLLADFRLVGGTALSLYRGHRISVDIDLFTDNDYGTVDYEAIDHWLQQQFAYVDTSFGLLPGMGRSYLVGTDEEHTIKLDLFYSLDKFLQPAREEEGIRLASLEDIVAMKMDVIFRGGRKKDFWDVHELLEKYSVEQMIALHKARAEFTHDEGKLRTQLLDFTKADDEYEPICLRGQHWEFIKEDIEEWLARH